MSVKRKFSKSKKTKGKTKDNNKHKNNEKRSKIQRKTKKRVLRGGLNTELVYENTNDGVRLRGMTGKFSILKPSNNECKTWFRNIANVFSPDNPPPIKPDTKAKKDFDYCQSMVGDYTTFSPPSTPPSEPEEPIITDAEQEARESSEPELQEEEPIHIRIKRAEEEVEKDSQVPTQEISNDSGATLTLSQRHEVLASKYKQWADNESDEEIKDIYTKAFEYHNFWSSKLYAEANITQAEKALPPPPSTSNVSAADVPVTNESDNWSQGLTDDEKAGLTKEQQEYLIAENKYQKGVEAIHVKREQLNNTADKRVDIGTAAEYEEIPEEPKGSSVSEGEKNKNLTIFPKICYNYVEKRGEASKITDTSTMCEVLKRAGVKRSLLLYRMLKAMKEWIIKNCFVLNFKDKLSEKNIIFEIQKKSFNLFIRFYNITFANEEDESTMFSPDGTKLPDIDLETFIANLYKLYDLSLEDCCSYFLAMTSFNVEGMGESKIITENFSLTSKDAVNLQKIINMLKQQKVLYEEAVEIAKLHTDVFKKLQRYDAILPSPPLFFDSILPIPDAVLPESYSGRIVSLLDVLEFIENYLLTPETTLVCTTGNKLFGRTTPADVRKKVEALLTKEIEKEFKDHVDYDDKSIFRTNCPFISKHGNLKKSIEAIVKENNSMFGDKSKCKKNSNFFIEQFSDDSILMDIFLHMLVYACYSVKQQVEIKTGIFTTIEGTDLMILFMKEFVIRFFNNLLQDAVNFYENYLQQNLDNPVLLMDKNNIDFFELVDKIILRIDTWNVKKQMRLGISTTHSQDLTTFLSGKIKIVKSIIDEKIAYKNKEPLEFIVSLRPPQSQPQQSQPPQQSQEPPQPQQSQQSQEQIEKSMLEQMDTYNLKVAMIGVCGELMSRVEQVYDKEHPGERESWEKEQKRLEAEGRKKNTQVLFLTDDNMIPEFNPSSLTPEEKLVDIKDNCKQFVVEYLIAQARKFKKDKDLNTYILPYQMLIELNRCCDPRDVFKKGLNSREHNKRITRAFYGLSEFWPHINEKQKLLILRIPGVRNLIHKFNTDESFRNLVQNQCNDDGKAEKKFGVRWWGMSVNRKGIMENIDPNDLPGICSADVTFSNEKKDLIYPKSLVAQEEPIETQETQKEIAARLKIEADIQRAEQGFAEDLAEAAANIAKNPEAFKLTRNEAERNLISIAQSNLETIDGKKNGTGEFSVDIAKKAIEEFKKNYLALYTIALIRHRSNIPRDKHIPEGKLARKFAESRKVKDQLVEIGIEPPTNKSLWQIITGTGGTTSTKNKTKHKPNHKAKAKTQFKSKPKHKNKSKSKLKHRTKSKSKTIKKNKRAHHKFDKKYTRKR